MDSSPIAVAITRAKAVTATPDEIMREYDRLIRTSSTAEIPDGDFWRLAYHPGVLETLCVLRQQLTTLPSTQLRAALTGILLGALHGPRTKAGTSYLSNQSPRTFSPKPHYAVHYWSRNGLEPSLVDVRKVVAARARRYYGRKHLGVALNVALGDARRTSSLDALCESKYRWIITSPPYYGLRTYLPDQWLRGWFLGGFDKPMYRDQQQLSHGSPEAFAADLRMVWRNIRVHATEDARMIVRFGGIHDRSADPLTIVRDSLRDSGWKILTRRSAGIASSGRRQADHFQSSPMTAREESDLWVAPAETT
jgi:hypothetical protein